MSKKWRITGFCSLAVALIIIYLLIQGFKDNTKEIEKVVFSLNQPMTKLVHIETLNSNQAIAFYQWGIAPEDSFGIASLKKDVLGWHLISGSTMVSPKDYKIGLSYSDLRNEFPNYKGVLYGEILDTQIVDILVDTTSGKKYTAKIIVNNQGEKFWFLIAKGVEITGATVTARSQDGKILQQIQI
ncbi:hypothetical protein J2Z69_001888 [Paenibacillus shirakamiensis]|uniref:DUF4309 domain-containing protein n=1 Tax=Paenibacillus shirakamiensis TaxID=1265935 RepID=A0ABS4JGL3_9BACL|nr:hypothetical protein [Paenibacillus shirakamiensis]MBP2000857.1 hypothetical protein [Paenibacillus shirakamiensis]